MGRIGAPALAAGLGATSVLAWAPVGAWPLLWLCLGVLYRLLDGASWRRAAALGLAFGGGLFLAGVSWVYVSLSVFGGLPAPLAALATLAFCAVLALFPALFMALFATLRGPGSLTAPALFAAAWGLADALRGWVLTGFPWLALGYTQTPAGEWVAPLQGFAPILGVYGVTALVALVAALGGEALRRGRPAATSGGGQAALREKSCTRRRTAAAALALLVVAGGWALAPLRWTAPAGAPLSVALLQGNIAQDLKWDPNRFEQSLRVYYELMRDHPAQLTVLPETALPTFYDRLPPRYLDALRELAARRQGDVVLGSVVGDSDQYTNSVVSLGAAPAQRYDKVHLVPYGEYPPPGFSWFMRLLKVPLAGFTAGAPGQPPFRLGEQRVAFNICYEDVFGEEIAASAGSATILINVSNTAWFGRSWAQPQHLQIAQMRALETGRPMLRATNTGMTAAVGPDGRVDAALTPFTRGALAVDVQGYQGQTPYLRYANAGAWLLILFLALPALVRRVKYR